MKVQSRENASLAFSVSHELHAMNDTEVATETMAQDYRRN